MDRRFFEALSELAATEFPKLEADGLIVYGQGRHFSSGADVGELVARLAGEGSEAGARFLAESTLGFHALSELPFPVVAAVGGCCFGSALELALACHYRVAARNAIFALPETTFGLMPGVGGTVRLPKLVGVGKAIEIILTGRALLAEEARTIGLVDLVVHRRRLLESAARLIHKLNRATTHPAA